VNQFGWQKTMAGGRVFFVRHRADLPAAEGGEK
jgi:hypothetical protein